MSDDLTKKHPQDGSRINKNQPYEVGYEANKKGVSKDAVLDALKKAGTSRKEVEKELDNRKS